MQRAQMAFGIVLLIVGASTCAMAIPVGVPEVAVGSAGSAVALVSGMLMLVRGRRRK
jgi:hypothetical protein